jgi:PAS domain S-box-containing protein
MLIGAAVTEGRLLLKANSYRDAVLSCVSIAVKQLIAQDDWKSGLAEILKQLGEASEVSHVYLLENRVTAGVDVLDDNPNQWVSPDLPIEQHQLKLLNLLSQHHLAQRIEELKRGSFLQYNRQDLAVEDRLVFAALGLRSTVVFPVIVEQRLWGCLGLDRSLSQGDWTDSEIRALRATASGLGTVIAQAKAEGQFRELAGNIRAVIWTSGPKGQRRTYVSPAYEQVWGRSLEELLHAPEVWKDSIHPEDVKQVESGLMTIREFDLEYRILLPDGETRWIRDRGFPIRNENGEIGRVVGIAEDISAQKQAEERIRGSTLLLTTLIDNLSSGILVEDEQRRVRHVNQAFCELFNVPTPKESLFETDSRLILSKSKPFADRIDVIRKQGEALFDEELAFQDLTLKRDYVPLVISDQDHFHLWQYQNITDAKQAEQKIKSSLSEKEVLLKEIHHRVKNNLQIICSLLSLQSNRIKDQEILEIFSDSQNRVKAMALVHERLYESQDLSRVDFPGYTRNLTDHLIKSYQAASKSIQLNLEVESVPMNINTAVPCGLIINELVSNSLKYAFDERENGLILIRLSQPNPWQLRLIVKDDGVGLPAGFDLDEVRTLGLKLVKGLAQQIGGEISFKNRDGTEFDIQFPLDGQMSQKGLAHG